jgi:MoaA/NifB/PqqE/SkfB family radical SAM enzyme
MRLKKRFSIEVKMTDRCNQACPHCVNGDGPAPGRDLDVDLFNRRLEEWARGREDSDFDLKEVRITGGEPLMRFEEVLSIAEGCRKLGTRSGINTNGLLLDSGRIRRLKESGIEVVKVSLDAMDGTAYSRLRGPLPSFQTLLGTIEELIRENFKVILRFTLGRENLGFLSPCCGLAGGLGVHKFQIKPLIRSGRATDPTAFMNSYEIDGALRGLADSEPGARTPVEVLCWPAVPGTSFSYKNCGSADKIYVSPDLLVSICNFVQDHRLSALGDLSRVPLETILKSRFDGTRTEDFESFSLIKGCPNLPQFQRVRA